MSLLDTPSSDQSDGKPEDQQGTSAVDQLLAEIKNDRGEPKYNSVEEALKGLANAQSHIPTLESELAELRGRLKSQEELKELLTPKQKQEQEENQIKQEQASAQSLSEDDIVAVLERREKAKVAEGNIAKVKAELEAQFGSEATKELDARGEAAGLTADLARELASTSPEAFLKLIGVESKKPAKKDFKSSVNTADFKQEEKPRPKFDPFTRSKNSDVDKWNESVERTKARLGIS